MDDTKNTEEVEKKIEDSTAYTDEMEKIDSVKCKKRKWRKFFLGIGVVFLMIVLGVICIISYLRLKGEKNLKAEEQYITYNGKEYKYKEEIINILCLGVDKAVPVGYIEEVRGNIGMSDVILLVSINVKRNEVKIIAIPRDTMTEVQRTDKDGNLTQKQMLQICCQYACGISMEQSNELTVNTVSHLLCDIPIQRCCAINFEAFSLLNDAIGGVDVVIDEDLKEFSPKFKDKDEIHLDGELALTFIRIRDTTKVDGAVARTQRQKEYAMAFVEKAKKVIVKNPTLPITLFQELQKSRDICTDITKEDMIYLLVEMLGISFSEDAIQVLEGESILGEDGLAEYYVDVDSLNKLIIDMFYEEV